MLKLYIEFKVNKLENFERLQKMFHSLKELKEINSIDHKDSRWKSFYSEELLKNFWWPTDDELIKYWRLYESIPAEERHTDDRLIRPWCFVSLIETIANGEYDLNTCELIKNDVGRLEFMTWSWPYKGTGSLKALVKSFGFEIIKNEV
ncbi:hypothetical protein PV797_09755 [Clostridiaceae bacterium M8S5]|nr:hypothetical protein PV797_09755 [Clostridiaceae bacterium M8S5]